VPPNFTLRVAERHQITAQRTDRRFPRVSLGRTDAVAPQCLNVLPPPGRAGLLGESLHGSLVLPPLGREFEIGTCVGEERPRKVLVNGGTGEIDADRS
jgi:hypothetical protein